MLAWPSESNPITEDRWSLLNNNRITHNDPALTRYHVLLDALDGGWTVEPPIYVRNDWSLKHKDTKVFHFVLRRNSLRMTTLLSVPDCEVVRGLIAENGWTLSPNEA